jgi:hypothetical protein
MRQSVLKGMSLKRAAGTTSGRLLLRWIRFAFRGGMKNFRISVRPLIVYVTDDRC